MDTHVDSVSSIRLLSLFQEYTELLLIIGQIKTLTKLIQDDFSNEIIHVVVSIVNGRARYQLCEFIKNDRYPTWDGTPPKIV